MLVQLYLFINICKAASLNFERKVCLFVNYTLSRGLKSLIYI